MDGKTLVLYVFHEKNDRVDQFLSNCLFQDPLVNFIVISNGYQATIANSNLPNNVTYFRRKNKGFDFGGWSDALFYSENYKRYDNFIFINYRTLFL